MKKNFLFLFLSLFVFTISGQDFLKTTRIKQINGNVIAELDKTINYRTSDCGGLAHSVISNQIALTDYKYGFIDTLNNQNPRIIRPLGVNGGITNGDKGYFRLLFASVGYFIIPQIELELNLGINASDVYFLYYFSTGAKIHFNSTHSEKSLTPYTGCLIGAFDGVMIQLPIGLNYLAKFGLNSSISLNFLIPFEDYPLMFAELKLGWKFKV